MFQDSWRCLEILRRSSKIDPVIGLCLWFFRTLPHFLTSGFSGDQKSNPHVWIQPERSICFTVWGFFFLFWKVLLILRVKISIETNVKFPSVYFGLWNDQRRHLDSAQFHPAGLKDPEQSCPFGIGCFVTPFPLLIRSRRSERNRSRRRRRRRWWWWWWRW